ncbi:hypothetical protein EVAR_73374_1 [Eumeta japonica]|uniref:Uncharacterized protein n=1 Tax=Eumeta variegata TaxID=151549 RepID=A0A4C1T197_EUMVA|nr:hypothetical protein EVAR_73374_1 [Eumeta japonica]
MPLRIYKVTRRLRRRTFASDIECELPTETKFKTFKGGLFNLDVLKRKTNSARLADLDGADRWPAIVIRLPLQGCRRQQHVYYSDLQDLDALEEGGYYCLPVENLKSGAYLLHSVVIDIGRMYNQRLF